MFVSEIVFPHVLVGAEYIYSLAISMLSLSVCSSINAADLYPSGCGSSGLNKCILSQETKVIPICSSLAPEHRLPVIRGLGSVWGGTLLRWRRVGE